MENHTPPATGPRYLLPVLAVALAVVVVTRFFLMGKGTFFLPDEFRYSYSVRAAQLLLHGDWREFCASLASTAGRPGDALVRLVPALLQHALLALTGLNIATPTSNVVPVLFNYVAVSLSAWYFYRICLLLLQNRPLALLGSVVYACLTNTNIYLRHILPYDAALLLMLFLVHYVLSLKRKGEPIRVRHYVGIGFLSALLVTVYPGYYMAPFIVLGVLVDWLHPLAFLQQRWKSVVAYVLGGAGVILLFEGVTRIGDASYIEGSYDLAHTIDQGSYEEGFTFLFKYLFQVEGLLGYALVLALLAYLVMVAVDVATQRERITVNLSDTSKLLVVAAAFFLLHAAGGVLLHRVVFYGRLLHPFMPFLVIVTLLLLRRITAPGVRHGLMLSLAGVALLSFGLFFRDYQLVVYPVDVIYRMGINTGDKAYVRYYNQIKSYPGLVYSSPEPRTVGGGYVRIPGKVITLLNFTYPFPLRPVAVPVPVSSFGNQLLFDDSHALNFRAYPFEGFTIAERQILPQLNLRIRVRAATL